MRKWPDDSWAVEFAIAFMLAVGVLVLGLAVQGKL